MTISQQIARCLNTKSGLTESKDEDESVIFDIDEHLRSSSKKVLLQRIIFVEARQSYNFNLKKLKSKYVLLNPKSSDHPKNSAMSPALKANAPYGNEQGHDGIPTPKVVIFAAEKIELTWRKTMRAGAGLCNLGNTCFLNSALQCLSYTAPLANYLVHLDHKKHCRLNGQFCMLCAMQQHVYSIHANAGHAIKPMYILKNLRMIAKHLQFGRQEDAHEFIRYSVDAMQKSCLHGFPSKMDVHIKATTVIHQIFGGYLRSRVKCKQCKSVSDTYDPFLDLSLDINKQGCIDLQRCLEMFVRVEVLQGDNAYKCNHCKTTVSACKKFSIHRPPNVLMVQLKRFSNFMGSKINKELSYPSKLNIGPYMSNRPEGGLWYELYAVLVHSGYSCQSGHYYTYAKAPNGQWYCFNDSSVHQVSVNQALNQQAYLLFYTRSPKTNSQLGNFKSVNKNLLGIPQNKLQNHHKVSVNGGGSSNEKEYRKHNPRPIIGPQLPSNMKNHNGSSFQSTSRSMDIGTPVSKVNNLQKGSCSSFSSKAPVNVNGNRAPLQFTINRKPKVSPVEVGKLPLTEARNHQKLTNGHANGSTDARKSEHFSAQKSNGKVNKYGSMKPQIQSGSSDASMPSASSAPHAKSWPSPILDKMMEDSNAAPSPMSGSKAQVSSSALRKSSALQSLWSYTSDRDDEDDDDDDADIANEEKVVENTSSASYSSISSTLKQLRQTFTKPTDRVKNDGETPNKEAVPDVTASRESTDNTFGGISKIESKSGMQNHSEFKSAESEKSRLDVENGTGPSLERVSSLTNGANLPQSAAGVDQPKPSVRRHGADKAFKSQGATKAKSSSGEREPILHLLNNEIESADGEKCVNGDEKIYHKRLAEKSTDSNTDVKKEKRSSGHVSNSVSNDVKERGPSDNKQNGTQREGRGTGKHFVNGKGDEQRPRKHHVMDGENHGNKNERKRHWSSESSLSSPTPSRIYKDDSDGGVKNHQPGPSSPAHDSDKSRMKRKREESRRRSEERERIKRKHDKQRDTSSSSSAETESSRKSPKKKKHSHSCSDTKDYRYWGERNLLKKSHSKPNGHSSSSEQRMAIGRELSLDALHCERMDYDASRRKAAKKNKKKRMLERRMMQTSINEECSESDSSKLENDAGTNKHLKKVSLKNERDWSDRSSPGQEHHRTTATDESESQKSRSEGNLSAKKEKKDEKVYKWDQKRDDNLSNTHSKERPNILAQLLKQSSGKAYGTKVDTWTGDSSLVEKDAQETWRDQRVPVVDDWDRDYDRGKTKKVKKKDASEKGGFAHNLFQKFQNMKNQRN